jgi:hypothetical protein
MALAQVQNSAAALKQQMWQEAGNNQLLQMNAAVTFPHVSARLLAVGAAPRAP